MKKKDKNPNKVSMFYDTEYLIIFTICFVGYLGILIFIWIDNTDTTQLGFNAGKAVTSAKFMTPILFFAVLSYIRRRVVDSKGVSSTYLGIKYKHISWKNLHHYTVEKAWPDFAKKRKDPTKWRAMLVFKAIPVEGKSTTIMIPATKEARALAEKYFGPPEFIQDGISFDEDKTP